MEQFSIRRLAVCVIVAAAVVAGCASSAPEAGSRVTLRNFRIDAPESVSAGDVRFAIWGAGPTMHELAIARTDLASDALPLAKNSTVDDERDLVDFHKVAEEEGVDLGAHRVKTVRLDPGHYVLYCNMPGHYLAGMHRELVVQ